MTHTNQPTSALLKFLQINLGNSAASNESLLSHITDQAYDILLMQEPYTVNSRIAGFETQPFRCFLSKGSVKPGTSYLTHGAAIIILNPDLIVLWRDDLSSPNISVATVQLSQQHKLSIVSAYFKFNVATGSHIRELSRIFNDLEETLILAADVNAASPL